MNRSLRWSSVAVTCAALIVATSARADWPANGRALCTQTANQFFVMIAPDGSGGAIVGWGDSRLAGLQAYSGRVFRNGLVDSGWPADGAYIGLTFSTYSLGRGISDDAGGAYFAWGGDNAPSSHHAFLQHVNGAGQVVSGWPADGLVVGNTPANGLPRIARDGSGGVLICWIDAGALIRVQHVLANGTTSPSWPAAGAVVTNVAGTYGIPYVISDGSGGAIVSWTDNAAGPGDVRAQHIDPGGTRVLGWPADGKVICSASGLQNVRQPLADGAGGAWLLWADDRDAGTTGRDIYVERIDGSGDPVSGWPAGGIPVCNAAGDQTQPSLASDGAAGIFVVWLDKRTAPDGDPYIQHLINDGTPAPGWVGNGQAISIASGGEQWSLDPIVADGAGGAIVVWSDARDSLTTGRDVYAQRFDSDGSVHSGWTTNGVVLCAATGDQTDVHCTSDASGGAIVAWTDGRTGDLFNMDIYAIGIRSDGTTPVRAALVSAEAASDRVRLDWYASETLPAATSIQRRSGDGPWSVLAPAVQDGLGHVRYEDRAVTAGAHYRYRLSDPEGPLTADTSVDVPVPSLSLTEVAADARGAVRVRYSLVAAGPASLQLFDLAGRCVRARTEVELGPGSHETRIPGPLPSGVYWLRLAQDGRSVQRKVVVAR